MSESARLVRVDSAKLEIINPEDDPQAYGMDVLRSELRDLDLRTGISTADIAERRPQLSDLQELQLRLARHRDYQVLESGETTTKIPFLVAAAPQVAGVEVQASLNLSKATEGDLSFKVAGTGPTSNAKAMVSNGYTLTCGPGEAQRASFLMPMLWERRADPSNEDYNWFVIRPASGTKTVEVQVELRPLPKSTVVAAETINVSKGLTKPFAANRSNTIEAGLGFSVGVKLAAIGLDISVSVKLEQTMVTEMKVSLPADHRYILSWLAGPPGLIVSMNLIQYSR